MSSLLDRRLVYVTGKGGVGKTTVATALARAGVEQGRRTLLCQLAQGRPVEGVDSVVVSPETALEEWLGKQVGGAALKILSRSQAFQYFVAAAPGAKEMVTLAKIWELSQDTRWTGQPGTYDLVVVDGPASGHGVAMLRTPDTFGDIAPGGPIRRQAYKVRDMLRDPARTGFVVVTRAEEMPVNETLELQDRLAETVGRDPEAIVVNGLYPERLSAAERDELEALSDRPTVDAALVFDARARAQRAHLRRLRRGARPPVVTVGQIFGDALTSEDLTDIGLHLAPRV